MRPNVPLYVNHRTRSKRDMNVLPVVLALAIAAPLAAQQPDRSNAPPPDSAGRHHTMYPGHRGRGPWTGNKMMGWGQGRRGSMGRDMAFDPARLLARKDVLGLSSQQVSRLTTLQKSAEPTFAAARTEIQKQRDAIAAVMKADAPDTVQLKQHLTALQSAANTAHWWRISTAIQARAVLNESQRGRVQGWADARRMGHSMGRRYHL